MRTVEHYWKTKKNNTVGKRFNKDGSPIEFKLTIGQMKYLFKEAGITPDDIGTGEGKYCLMRNGDSGHYEIGNCSFGLTSTNASDATRGIPKSEEHKKHISESTTGKPKTFTDASYAQISNFRKNQTKGSGNPFYGKKHTDSTKSKMSEAKKGLVITCPHCGKQGGQVMYRWHFDNCKFKES